MSELEYRKEQAAAKILEFFKVYELLTAHYAEILALYPEAAKELTKTVPGLSDIEKAGEEILARVSKK
ncbi:MAG: hypothetical protein KBC41_01580 [Candidatus Pacebacteria bacterium]|nr:hypothetical protein [Candidatus Paceibacterota bacterium]